MRYLWAEDFDGKEDNWMELQKRWKEYFEINNPIIIDSLEDVLLFLEQKENWKLFDAILIDIRFKVCSRGENEDIIYDKYFKDFLDYKKFKSYTKCVGTDPDSASSGILLYLALVHRYNYNQSRVAFVSANVDGTGSVLNPLKHMRNYFYKSMFEELGDDAKDRFSVMSCDLYGGDDDDDDEKSELVKLVEQCDPKKEYYIPNTEAIDWNNADKYVKILNELEQKLHTKIENENRRGEIVSADNELKYNSVKKEFANLGLIVSKAFEKPSSKEGDEKISWEFKHWKKGINTDYYKLRSVILPICDKIEKKIRIKSSEEKKMPYEKLQKEETPISADILNMLSNIMELFPSNEWTDNDSSLYTRIVRECVSLCDAISKPKCDNLDIKHAAHAVMKITRNWISHQGLGNLSIFDVAFIFYMMIITFFVGNKSDDYELSELKNQVQKLLLECAGDTTFTEEKCDIVLVKNLVNDLKLFLKEMHKESYELFVEEDEEKAKSVEKIYKYDETKETNGEVTFYDRISAIGNQYSILRKNVDMEHIYLLYVGVLDDKILDKLFGDTGKADWRIVECIYRKLLHSEIKINHNRCIAEKKKELESRRTRAKCH